MEDSRIIELFFARDEKAISETHVKYGRYCYSIAYNILAVNEDCEECVNDTLMKAWNAVLDELAECVSSGVTTEDISDNNTLRHALNDFLFCLEPEKRIIFMQRYWYMMPVKAIAAEHSSTESRIKMILLRTRSELKEHLIKEGITL